MTQGPHAMPWSTFALWFFGPASTYPLVRLALRRAAWRTGAAGRPRLIYERSGYV
jgi:hypothetical protein